MTAWLKFKDIVSQELGVEIENMPPISKAPIKYDIIEIPGKNKVDVVKHGYRPYYKPVQLGISNFDKLDEIIEWLSGEGELIFSNESDKYYNAMILDQVDYESALIFRRTTVAFFVQPFKYAIYNEPVVSLSNMVSIVNDGNIFSEPKITVYGSGTLTIKINQQNVCTLSNVSDFITVDSAKIETYKETVLKNRSKSGEFPILNPGINDIEVIGQCTKIEVVKNTRWR